MDKPTEQDRFRELLQYDKGFIESEYKEYRMKLEQALSTARSREKIALRVVVVSFILALLGMFVGGSRILGSFDPTEKEATILSIACGLVYSLALVTFWISLASYFSRFRVNVRNTQEQLRDANITDLQRAVSELKQQLAALSRRDDLT